MKSRIAKMKQLKQQILKVGPAVPGTIRKTYLKCGKSNCECMLNDRRHGPYFRWDRKVGDRLVSKSLGNGQDMKRVQRVQRWIDNRKRLEALVSELLALGGEQAVKQLER